MKTMSKSNIKLKPPISRFGKNVIPTICVYELLVWMVKQLKEKMRFVLFRV